MLVDSNFTLQIQSNPSVLSNQNHNPLKKLNVLKQRTGISLIDLFSGCQLDSLEKRHPGITEHWLKIVFPSIFYWNKMANKNVLHWEMIIKSTTREKFHQRNNV